MNSCPIPLNEDERLASVRSYNILDTEPEVEFDVTTRVASALFDAPIALVALMDQDRLWFKSKHGLALPQLDRKIAFCAHAIVQPNDLLVINDLKKDARFDDNPLVHGGPELRFYAGAPLLDANGLALGTIAVLGTQPREFDEKSRSLLRDLSVSVMTAIDSRHRAMKLKQMATTDPLTGLANRIQFQSAATLELGQAKRSGQSIGILYMDLDGFKGVNDSLGHGAGDAVLRHVAARLKAQIRNGETLARLGGDEFALVMRAGSDLQGAVALAQRIVESVSKPMALREGQVVSVGVSIGIALADARNCNLSSLIEKSDNALYRAKAQVHQRWAVYGDQNNIVPTLLSPVELPLLLISGENGSPIVRSDQGGKTFTDVKSDAYERSDQCNGCSEGVKQPFAFTMAFQPIVSASRKDVFAYEALVRGPNGEGAATVLGQVNRKNRYAFDQSCRQTAVNLAAKLGIVALGVKLSINFIPGAMYEPENCVRATLAAARRARLPLDRLIFEVTEGEEVLEPVHLAKIFEVYKKHGFSCAIDDFGSGYAGLNMLARFQPDVIKIDRALIESIDSSWPKQSIVRGVLSVCKDLKITPIAEGVETELEYHALRALGVDLFQGFLFAKPGFESFPTPVYPSDED